MTLWEQWAVGVLSGVNAPSSSANIDTLWAWSNAESGTDVMRWNNPLNTTQLWPGAQNMNSVGVKRYPSVQDGIGATVVTLLNGFYPTIIAHLRSSTPRSQWGDACAELGKWGTGCGWLTRVYGGGGGVIVDDVTQEEHDWLYNLHQQWGTPVVPGGELSLQQAALAKLQASLNALTATTTPSDGAAVLAAIADLKAALSALQKHLGQGVA